MRDQVKQARENWEHQDDGNRLPPFEHSQAAKVGGPIVSRHEPSEPDYRSHREGAPIAVFAQYPDRTVAHRSAGDAKMNTGEEEQPGPMKPRRILQIAIANVWLLLMR